MNLEQARFNMVEQQIRTWEVLDQDVLDLLYLVPREEFVPPQHRSLAFSDIHIPLGEGQRMWEPKMEARVLQELTVRKSTDRVLEVGTGSGYLTALLARHGAENITLEAGDAARGWSRHAPYEVIVLTGSSPLLPRAFLEQLAVGGRLFAVTGEAPAMSARLVVCTAPGAYHSTDLFETVIAPLVNAEQPPRFRF